MSLAYARSINWMDPGENRWDEDLMVTPEIAKYWLARVSPKQAKIRRSLVDRYAMMRKAGLWDERNDDPIKLDVLGEVINGKHRLTMVAETGLPTRFHIHYNVPTEVYDTTDTGRLRGLDDVAYPRFHGSKRAAAISKAMAFLPGGAVKSTSLAANLPAMRLFQERHQEAIAFASGLFVTAKRGLTSPVHATVAKAYYYVPTYELVLFANRLYTGIIAEEGEVSAVRLRDWLFSIDSTGPRSKNGRETYMKTARAIQLFQKRQAVTKLYPCSSDPFPLPESTADEQ
jgi:hypothetical protein